MSLLQLDANFSEERKIKNKMILNVEPSIVTHLPGNFSVTLIHHLENLISSYPDYSKHLGNFFVQIPSTV